jgi:alkylation response protein AidB-like acyl-CoA dehydrogenase
VAYAKERVQHGKQIGKHQLIQRHIGFMNRNLEAARLLVYKAAALKDRFNADRENVALRDQSDIMICKAKHYAANASFDAASRAVQIYGANGYSLENRPGRHFCDCRVTSIYEGANEILEQKMALEVLGKDFAAFR